MESRPAMMPVSSQSHRRANIAEEGFPWRKPNPRKGANYIDLALAFKQDFPEGKLFRDEEFDQWAAQHGLYCVPTDVGKKSDAWMAMLQRRHRAIFNINKAATHPRMNDLGVGAYHIAPVAKPRGWYHIQAPHEGVAELALTKKLASLLVTKRKQLEYLMQSQDWSLVPSHERVLTEEFYYHIDTFEKRFDFESNTLNAGYQRLTDRLKRAVESAGIVPKDGGIHRLLEQPNIDVSPVTDDDLFC